MTDAKIITRLTFFLIALIPSVSHANLVTFLFEGSVIRSNKESTFSIDQSISGQYTFDSSTTISFTNGEQSVYDAVREFSFNSGTYSALATPQNTTN